MSKLSDLREEYNEYKNYSKQLKFGGNDAKCDLCNKWKKTCYNLQLYTKGDKDCGCTGIGCNSCRMEEENDFALVCSEQCETMLILKVMA